MNTDISKLKTDNKLYNVEFLTKTEIFKRLCVHTDCVTDTSLAYVPWIQSTSEIKRSDGKIDTIEFIEPCSSNNYADLSFINANTYYNFKACRIKTFNAIPMDGSLLTYDKNSVSDDNYIVFYSINPNEINKILIVSTHIYDFLVSYNENDNLRYFNIENLNDLKKNLGLKDLQIAWYDCSYDIDIPMENEINIDLKRKSCLCTVGRMKIYKANNKNRLISSRTHFGNQYSAFNLISGEMRQFRDCHSRNLFFESKGIELPDNHIITRNCKNMKRIVECKESDNYKVNIYDNGWVILPYMTDHSKIIEFLRELLIILNQKSKRIASRIRAILSKSNQNFIFLANRITKRIKNMRKKIKEKINYPRPLHLFEFAVGNLTINKYSYFKKYYKIKI